MLNILSDIQRLNSKFTSLFVAGNVVDSTIIIVVAIIAVVIIVIVIATVIAVLIYCYKVKNR